MWRCKYCGGVADAAGCAHCGTTAVEYVPDIPDDVPELIDVTCLGDTERRYMDARTGKIVAHRYRGEEMLNYDRPPGLTAYINANTD